MVWLASRRCQLLQRSVRNSATAASLSHSFYDCWRLAMQTLSVSTKPGVAGECCMRARFAAKRIRAPTLVPQRGSNMLYHPGRFIYEAWLWRHLTAAAKRERSRKRIQSGNVSACIPCCSLQTREDHELLQFMFRWKAGDVPRVGHAQHCISWCCQARVAASGAEMI